MYELELFAGAGGGLLAQGLLGHHPVGAVEIEPYCRALLLQRQRDLCLPVFPVWDDVTTFRADNPQCADYIEWLRTIAGELCISGGFPCQNISSCGKGEGISGRKSGLWFEMARIIDEIRPRFVFVENSPMLVSRGFEMVLASLAGMGYDARWCVLGAGDLGYPILRKRLWILGINRAQHGERYDAGNEQSGSVAQYLWRAEALPPLPDASGTRLVSDGLAVRTPDGLAGSVEPVGAVGNGQVPAVAAVAWRLLTGSVTPRESGNVIIHNFNAAKAA